MATGIYAANSMTVDEELVEAAAGLVPVLAERAEEAERLRRLPDETVADLDRTGITRLSVPRRFGGGQASAGTFLRVAEELARGCGSTSFVSVVYGSVAYIVALFPDEAQEEVFSDEDARVFNTFNPGGTAIATEDGFVLSGRWPFCSGQHHSTWGVMSALMVTGDTPEMGLFLVPRSSFQSIDDWDVVGLVATGSITLSLEDEFVPRHRVLPLSSVMAGEFESTLARTDPYYQVPLLSFGSAGPAGTALGLGRAALDEFGRRMNLRGITYTLYHRQADASITHFQMAEASMTLDHARFHGDRIVQSGELGSVHEVLDRARCRADSAWTVRLCREVVDIVQSAAGANAIYRRDPFHRVVRDMQAMSVHSLLLPTTNAELYGRVLCGVDPGTPFV